MIAKEVYSAALALLLETEESAGDYNAYALPLLNLLLPELFDINNSILQAEGIDKLKVIPQLENLDDEIPYDERLLRNALPYGLAAKLVYDDNDMGKVGYFQQLYVNAVNSFLRIQPEMVVDIY